MAEPDMIGNGGTNSLWSPSIAASPQGAAFSRRAVSNVQIETATDATLLATTKDGDVHHPDCCLCLT